MEAAAAKVESAFEETNQKLDQMEKQVDVAWKEANQGQSTVEIVKSLQDIKAEYKSVLKDVEELKQTQQSAMEQMFKELDSATKSLEGFKTTLGEPPKENEDK